MKNYMNPYLAGFLLGLVLLATIFVTGRGLGASGADQERRCNHGATRSRRAMRQTSARSMQVATDTDSPLNDWLVFEVAGVVLGAFLSGIMFDRLKFFVEGGPRVSSRTR